MLSVTSLKSDFRVNRTETHGTIESDLCGVHCAEKITHIRALSRTERPPQRRTKSSISWLVLNWERSPDECRVFIARATGGVFVCSCVFVQAHVKANGENELLQNFVSAFASGRFHIPHICRKFSVTRIISIRILAQLVLTLPVRVGLREWVWIVVLVTNEYSHRKTHSPFEWWSGVCQITTSYWISCTKYQFLSVFDIF